MAMRTLREGTSQGLLKYFLFALLGMAVGGLMLMDVGGFFRGGISSTDVATIGDDSIKINQFHRDLQQRLRRAGLTAEQAYQLGYVDQIIASVVSTSILRQEAKQHGLQVSEEEIAKQIKQIVTPMAGEEMSAKDVFKQILRNQGLSETQFVERVGGEQAQAYFVSALQAGFSDISSALLNDVYRGQNETRTIEFISFPHKNVTDIGEPSEEQLSTLYAVTKDQKFAIPEERVFKVGILDDARLRKTLVVSDEEVKKLYEDNIDAYKTPDSRTLEQTLLNNKDQAIQIYNLVKQGKTLEAATNEVTGSTVAYLGEKTIPTENILDDIKGQVLAVEKEGTALEPTETPLGWNITIVQKIQPAATQPLSEVSENIKKEIQDDLLYDQIYDLSTQIDDMLASGMTLEEVAQDAELKLITLPPLTQQGSYDSNNDESISQVQNFKDLIIELGFDLQSGEISPVTETDAGQYFAVSVQDITPKTYQPFESVKDQLVEKWEADQRMLKNAEQLGEKITTLQGEDIDLTALAKQESKYVQTIKGIDRQTQSEPLTFRAIQRIFETNLNTPIIIELNDGLALAQVSAFDWPEISENDADGTAMDLKTLELELTRQLQDEAIQLYILNKEPDYSVQVNQPLLEQMYDQNRASF